FRIEVGHAHGVKPGNIMGAIANEAGLEGRYIGRIQIFDDHSLVDLPESMPPEIFQGLKRTRVAGQALRISRTDGKSESTPEPVEETVEPKFSPSAGKAHAPKSESRETAHSGEKRSRPNKAASASRSDSKPKPAGKARFSDKKRDEKPHTSKPA